MRFVAFEIQLLMQKTQAETQNSIIAKPCPLTLCFKPCSLTMIEEIDSARWPALDFGAALKHLMRHIIQRVGAGLWCLYEGVSYNLSQNAPVLAGSRSWSTNSPQLPAGVIHALISAPVTSKRCQADWQVGITGRSVSRHGRTFEGG